MLRMKKDMYMLRSIEDVVLHHQQAVLTSFTFSQKKNYQPLNPMSPMS